MKDPIYKTSKADFDFFVKEFLRWIDFWGLKQWHFYFEQSEDTDCYAWIDPDYKNTAVGVYFSTRWVNFKPNREYIAKVAFHEVGELLLTQLGRLARKPHIVGEAKIAEETHNIIRILENTVWQIRK